MNSPLVKQAMATFGLLLIPLTAAAALIDISGHIHAEAVLYVKSQGIVSGYSDNTYRPDIGINRAEFTKIIVETHFSDEDIANCDVNVHTFSDVDRTAWYAKYVCIAKKYGIIGGYPDGTFRPAASINFVEASKILSEAFALQAATDTNVWFKGYVDALASLHAIPIQIEAFDSLLTRGQMAEMVYRLHASIQNKSSLTYSDLAGIDLEAEALAEIDAALDELDLLEDEADDWDNLFSEEEFSF